MRGLIVDSFSDRSSSMPRWVTSLENPWQALPWWIKFFLSCTCLNNCIHDNWSFVYTLENIKSYKRIAILLLFVLSFKLTVKQNDGCIMFQWMSNVLEAVNLRNICTTTKNSLEKWRRLWTAVDSIQFRHWLPTSEAVRWRPTGIQTFSREKLRKEKPCSGPMAHPNKFASLYNKIKFNHLWHTQTLLAIIPMPKGVRFSFLITFPF